MEKGKDGSQARSVSSITSAGRLSPEQAFCRDIPEVDQEDVFQRMFEPIYGNPQEGVTILNHDRSDAINSVAEGVIEHEGREYWFCIEDGNRNGSVLIGWEDSKQQTHEAVGRRAQEFERYSDLANHIARMAQTGTTGSVVEWSAFLESLCDALIAARSESEDTQAEQSEGEQ